MRMNGNDGRIGPCAQRRVRALIGTVVVAVAASAILTISVAGPAHGVTRRTVTRNFNATAKATLQNVSIANCIPLLSYATTFQIERPNLGPWTGSFQGCVPPPNPQQESFSFSGGLTLVTARGVHLNGYGQFNASLSTNTIILTITGSDGEYVAGQLSIDLGRLGGALAGPVTGTVDVVTQRRTRAPEPTTTVPVPASKIRPVTGSAVITGVMTQPDNRCQSGQGAVLTGVLNREGSGLWPFTVTGCVGNGPAPTFAMTTHRGITIVGNATFLFQGTFLALTFNVVSASAEYIGGQISMSGNADLIGPGLRASGQLVVA